MTVAAYQYLSEDGTTYQVVLPSDFASVLGYVPATGLEAYLPAYISPRYATYQSMGAVLWANVVITRPFSLGSPPGQVSIGSIVYQKQSTYGEQRGAFLNPNVMLISGPQGPAGSAGAQGPAGTNGTNGTNADIVTLSGTLSNAQMKALFTSPVTLLAAQGAGKVIHLVHCSFKLNPLGTAFVGGSQFLLQINGNTVFTLQNATMLGTSIKWSQGEQSQEAITANQENQALIATGTSNYTTGTGTLQYNLDYRVVTFNAS